MKKTLLLLLLSLSFLACDKKKTSIGGKVTNAVTGEPVNNALVNYVQCQSSGDNCNEIVIGQVYTNTSGEFVIDQKTASKSKDKWIDVYYDNKKVGHQDNISLKDKSINIAVTL
jgi:hypothetical protein